jgi:hypothetical protein
MGRASLIKCPRAAEDKITMQGRIGEQPWGDIINLPKQTGQDVRVTNHHTQWEI